MKIVKDTQTTFSTRINSTLLGLAAAIYYCVGILRKVITLITERVEDCLQALQEACNRYGENIVPYCIEAVRANATEGELAKVFRKAFGLWKPPVYW